MFIRAEILPLIHPAFAATVPTGEMARLWWVFAIWLFFFYYEGLYTKSLSFWDEIKNICKSVFFASVGVFAIASVGKLGDDVSRTVIILMGVISLFLLPPLRMALKSSLRRAGLLKRRVLILGAGETGKLILKALKREPNFGYEVIGFLDDDPNKIGTKINGAKIHRGIDSAEKYIKHCNVSDLVIAMPGAGRQRLEELVNRLQHKVNHILFVPDVFGAAVMGTTLQHFFYEQAFALELKNNLARPLNYFTKRVFDYAASLFIFALLALPLAAIAAIIKLTSPGPAIYRQKRVGKKNREFYCFKFRTMYADADKRLKEILDRNPDKRAEWERFYKLKDDPRVTPIGRFLRRTSLDELPQIFNVLKGDMSLVGPRPVTREEIDKYYRESAELCFCVMPGITGLWQVSGRSNTDYDYRISLDSWYVRNWNLWLDIVILIRTIAVVFRKEGAY